MRTDHKENERKTFVVVEPQSPKRPLSRCSPLVGSSSSRHSKHSWYLDNLGTTWETMYQQEPCDGAQTSCFVQLMLTLPEDLPRQARDKHSTEKLKKT